MHINGEMTEGMPRWKIKPDIFLMDYLHNKLLIHDNGLHFETGPSQFLQ